ncbi:MFS transporter [Streptantibioticus silvisoli]|uniref:MFS transporter n=1 Tax=Streptantibioticus silvisoli TaxID=2705255 RepID=A0ABT6VVD7_9ACTN|nr:MFS transporter [Streptantibioticus silvisoli]MDI5962409.1 MFS transporter [Streptantibioticus silvisoli]
MLLTSGPKVGARNRLLVTVVAGGVFASVASLPMVLLASAAMVRGFHISYTDLQWRNLLFWTVFGVTLPLFGRVTERVAPRTQFVCGIAVFAVSAVIGALATNWQLYLVSPALQGLADAIVVSAQAVLIRAMLPSDRVGWAFGWQGAVLAAAQLGSPALGGFLLEHTSWRAVYWIVLGVGALAGAAALALLPGRTGEPGAGNRNASPSPLPVAGTCILGVAVAAWQAVVLTGGLARFGAVAVAVAATATFWVRERRTPAQNRYLPSGLLQNRAFFFTSLRGLLLYFPVNAIGMFLPLALLAVDGWSTVKVGVVLLLDALVVTFAGGTAGSFADRSPQRMVRVGFLSLTVSAVVMAFWSDTLTGVCAALLLLGLGVAAAVPGQSKIAMEAAPEQDTGSYMSVFQSAQFVSIGLASVVFAPLMQGARAQALSRDGFEIVCLVCAVLFAAGVVSVVDRTRRGDERTGTVQAQDMVGSLGGND